MIAAAQDAPLTLIADDQPDVLEALGLLLKREGHRIRTASSPPAVLRAMESQDFDLLLMDLNYARDTTSGGEGLDLVSRVLAMDGTMPVVVMTAWGSVPLAVEAMRLGAAGFVEKPWDNARLLAVLHEQVERGRAARKTRLLQSAVADLRETLSRATDASSLLQAAAVGIGEALDRPVVRIAAAAPPDCALSVPVPVAAVPRTAIHLGVRPDGRPFDEEERRFVSEAAAALGLKLDALQARLHDAELEAAHAIQVGLLPRELPRVRGFEIAAHWRPAGPLGGDSFDVLRLDDDHVALCISDAVGKGAPAALLTSSLHAAVRASASAAARPVEICARLNRILYDEAAPGRLISFFYGLLDACARRLVYAGAGHLPPILLSRDGARRRLSARGPLLGLAPEWSCAEGEVALTSGDRLVLFTDGVTEARDERDEEFGEERFAALLARVRHLGPRAMRERILAALDRFCPDGLQDDATLLTLAVGDLDGPRAGRSQEG